MDDASSKRKRKEEAKGLKRKKIEESGGIRPRNKPKETHDRNTGGAVINNSQRPQQNRESQSKKNVAIKHRFGRVMESVPCRNKPRYSTLSIALPGSVVSNCQTRELKTQLVGQIARACAVYHVDEIIVFDDKLAEERNDRGYFRNKNRDGKRREHEQKEVEKKEDDKEGAKEEAKEGAKEEHRPTFKRSEPHTFMARVLQYCECPQYLRRQFFPMHPDLQFTGLLSPLDSPHHVRAEERSKYREGVVMDRKGTKGSLVNCGIKNRPVEIDRVLMPNVRVTVELDVKVYGSAGKIFGKVVSPAAPREDDGTYWGYTTRLAPSINAVFDECPFEGGYDLKIGTSERGDITVDDKDFSLPKFQHSLIVFGGVSGIEECMDADETLKVPGSQSRSLFDLWVNTCPYQGSRTIRTEEAVLISLCRLSPYIATNATTPGLLWQPTVTLTSAIDFSDDDPSDESSCSEI